MSATVFFICNHKEQNMNRRNNDRNKRKKELRNNLRGEDR